LNIEQWLWIVYMFSGNVIVVEQHVFAFVVDVCG